MAYYNELKKYENNIAIIDDIGRSISYAELDMLCREIGNIIPKRSLVFSFCENSIGSVGGYVAFLYNHIVPVLLDKNIDAELRKNLIKIYQPDYLYVPEMLVETIEREFVQAEHIWSEHGYIVIKTHFGYQHQLHDDLALLVTTSGSTGSPKLVRQSYTNIQANAESIAEYLQIDETERPITTLPMNYTYGLSIINSHLLKGATILVTNRTLMEREFWTFFKAEEATSFGGVPYTYEILKKLRFFRMDLPTLRYMTQSGSKLAPELHKEFAEYAQANGKKFVAMYGQSEATSRIAYLSPEKAVEKYGSMGKAIPGGRLDLVDVNGDVVIDPDVVGELVYYGPNVTLGYAEKPEDLQKGDERFGRLETGDMAKRDSEGYFYIVGRKKRFLKIYGNRVSLDETERILKSYLNSQECDCVCAGMDDRLYVFLTDASDELKNNVRRFLAEKTGLNSSAFKVKYIEKIPKNEAGKTLYIKLEEFYDGV